MMSEYSSGIMENRRHSQNVFFRSPEVCLICEARSTGVHYGVISCEGCKAFFKRSIGGNRHYKCYVGGNCKVGPETKGRCKACRFKKCREMGMDLKAAKMGRTPRVEKLRKLDVLHNNGGISVHEIARNEFIGSNSGRGGGDSPESFNSYPSDNSHRNESHEGRADYFVMAPRKSVIRSTAELSPAENEDNCQNVEIHNSWHAQNSRDECDMNTALVQHRNVNTTLDLNGGFLDDMNLPNFLKNYVHASHEMNTCLEQSLRCIMDGVRAVFCKDLLREEKFRHQLAIGLQLPVEPRVSIDEASSYVKLGGFDLIRKFEAFAHGLPGFSSLRQEDRALILRERHFDLWTLYYTSSVQNNDIYCLMGEEDSPFIYNRFWMERLLHPLFLKFFFIWMDYLKDLHLSVSETYAFAATRIFSPDFIDASDSSLLRILHAHYFEAFMMLIGRSRTVAEQKEFTKKLKQITDLFPVVHRVNRDFLQHLDCDTYPWRAPDESEILRNIFEDVEL